MKKVWFLTMVLFFCSYAYAEVLRVNDMEEVHEYFTNANSKTLVIFDIDMVLVQPSDPCFQMANMKRFSPIVKRIVQRIPTEKVAIFFSLMTVQTDSVLIDSKTPEYILELHKRRIPVMALTQNLTGKFCSVTSMESFKINALKELGIDFSKGAPYKQSLIFSDLPTFRGNFSTYMDGVFFVNGTVCSKGLALRAFLEKLEFYPEKVIFVDDREENLTSVEEALQQMQEPIEYIGIHYVGAKNFPSEMITEAEFEARWEEIAEVALITD